MTTYSTSSLATSTRSSAPRIALAPRSVAAYADRPPPSRPNGVRTAETMTERVMAASVTPVRLTARAAVGHHARVSSFNTILVGSTTASRQGARSRVLPTWPRRCTRGSSSWPSPRRRCRASASTRRCREPIQSSSPSRARTSSTTQSAVSRTPAACSPVERSKRTTSRSSGRPPSGSSRSPRSEAADLIVVGAGHAGFFARLFEGSVSDAVSHESRRDVLIVQ